MTHKTSARVTWDKLTKAMRELDNETIRQEAGQVMDHPDFLRYQPREEQFDFMKWLREHFRTPEFDGNTPPIVWETLFFIFKILAALMVLAIVVWVIRQAGEWLSRSKKRETGFVTVTEQHRQQAKESYRENAQAALANGNYRQAIHYLFLATVSLVVKDTLFHGTDNLTNRELSAASDFSRFQNAPELGQLFSEMVLYDEPRWFGTIPSEQTDYQHFQALYERFHTSLVTRHA